jgi:hypothetical protein
MSERDIGQEILAGIQEIKAYKAGEVDLRTRELKEPSPPPRYSPEFEFVTSCFCRFDGGQFTNRAGLGTRATPTKRSGEITAADCRTTPGSFYGVGMILFLLTFPTEFKPEYATLMRTN